MSQQPSPDKPDRAEFNVELVGGPLDGALAKWPDGMLDGVISFGYAGNKAFADYRLSSPIRAEFIPGSIEYSTP